ncbi:MAG: rod-binding protein [Armatimonadota bacterium]|nr:rod-binding protein [Armatimonadota bacterium]MDW8157231.1 rod-binding protein [Armatimonadota bacterium]
MERLPAAAQGVGQPDPRGAARLRRAAQEFESLLLAQVLKSVRRATEIPSRKEPFAGRSVWRELLDEQLALAVARGGGLGLARYLEEALGGRRRPGPEDGR